MPPNAMAHLYIMRRECKGAAKMRSPTLYPISKKRDIKANLRKFQAMLAKHHAKIGWSTYLSYVHHYIRRCHERLRSLNVAHVRQAVQVCAGCAGWQQKMLTCSLCEDNYHSKCLPQQTTNHCPKCSKYNSYLTQYVEQRCEGCGKAEGQLSTCMKCTLLYHPSCFGMYGAVCTHCYLQVEKQVQDMCILYLELTQKNAAKEQDKEEESTRLTRVQAPQNVVEETVSEADQKTRKFKGTAKPKGSFYHLFPSCSEEELSVYKKDLLYGICCKRMQYSANLVPINCTLNTQTEHTLDFGVARLNAFELTLYELYKRQPIGPFRLHYTQEFGFDVVADCDLLKYTLVCEYVAEVITWRQALEKEQKKHNDSIMELQMGRNADQTLIIRPQIYTNIARFINGAKCKSQINVQTVRKISPNGPIILLYTCKNIKKGSSLYYQYNGENRKTYDTSDFK